MTLSGWQLDILRRDAQFILYRVRETGSPETKLAKALSSDRPRSESLARLGREHDLKDELEPQWAVHPLDLVRWNGLPMLLLEDPGGSPLDGLVGQPMEIGLFLRVASELSAALAKFHDRGLVHKDIKPANVWFDACTSEVRLTGFGIATRQPRERHAPESLEDVDGTLAYMAPEQTGRMNRSIDSRSDLYAVGVTFYEMLTGVLPFDASDPIELFHCHLARQAIEPAERTRGVPELLSTMVMKLLAKAAEDRYQTASGLEADLRRCRAQWEEHGRIDAFPLGTHDASDRLLVPEKLYGREAAIDVLTSAFGRVATEGALELVLVSGYAGIGKSSVVNELHKVLVPRHGLFAAGKFDEHKRDIPYATLSRALRGVVQQILGQNETLLGRWRGALLAALGTSGHLVAKLIPEIELIVGQQPPGQEALDVLSQDAQHRFQMVFRRLLGVFAQPEHPLVLFLDDLQWLDSATLGLLEYLIGESDLRHLLLIGAYRDNEVDAIHPLMRTLGAIRRAGRVPVHELVLGPLGLDDVERLLADTLHAEGARVRSLAELVHQKTGGNPFFTNQFISALAEERQLVFEPSTTTWSWDIASIHAKGFTENVVDLMIGKMNRLPDATQDAMKILACLGSNAGTAHLSLVLGTPDAEIHAALWDAVRTGLVFRWDGAYSFLHDRIREAAYSLLSEDERAAEHLRIGRLLVSRMGQPEIEAQIFEVVNQFNRGAELITSLDERERLAELNLAAGRRAKESIAYAAALKYLSMGHAMAPQDCWKRRYELAFALEYNLAECEYLTGNLPAAEQRLSMLADRAANLTDLAAVTCAQVNLFTTLDRSDRAVEAGLAYLGHVNVQWPTHPSRDDVRDEFKSMFQRLGTRTIEGLIDIAPMCDADSRATMDVLTAILPPTLFTDENLLGLVVCRMANISLEHGHSDGSCIGYAWLGMFLGPRFGNYEVGHRFAKLGLDLVDKRGLSRYKARVYLHFGNVVNPWSCPFHTGRPWIRRAFEVANESGDLTFAVYSCNHLITNLLISEEPLAEIEHETEVGLAFARKARFGLVVDIITGQQQLIRSLRGATASSASTTDAVFNEVEFERHVEQDSRLAIAACWYWIRKLQAKFLAGEGESAIEAAIKAQHLLWTSPSHIELAEYHFFGALARASQCDRASPEEGVQLLVELASHQRQLQEWAQNCNENFRSRAALVSAEIARVECRGIDAMGLYEQAIQSARDSGFAQTQGLAHELAARFYLAHGSRTAARAHLDEACSCFAHWGAEAKVKQLDTHFPKLRAQAAPTFPAPSEGVGQFDVVSVAKASQAISGRIVLVELVDTLLRIVLENAGAQTGYLFLVRDNELVHAAEASVEQHEIEVQLHLESSAEDSGLPDSILNYVRRSKVPVLLPDADHPNPFSMDPRLAGRQSKSVLCLPITRQSALIGLLYLENNLVTRAFTPERLTVLELLAAQAAISLENALLYADLQRENVKRQRAEATLREQDSRIRRLVESNIIGVFFWNLAGDITEANDAFLQLVGYSRQDLLSGEVRWASMTPSEHNAADIRATAELQQSGTCAPYEKEFLRKDGQRVPVLIGAAFLEGSTEHGVAFVLDLTERRQADAEREARRAAVVANRAKSAFLATMSHELRTPLNAVLGYAQLLKYNKTLDNRTLAGLNTIQQGGEQLLALINDILDLSRIEAGKVVLNPEPIILHEFLRTISDIIKIKAEEKGLLFRLEEAPGIAQSVRLDERRLRQVLLNLSSNAVKFTERGEVDLRVSSLGASELGVRLRFEVQDTGIGIPPGQFEAIFAPFEQVAGVERRFGGTGLGLSICRQLVRLMGGDVHVESVTGVGSRFWFDLDLPTENPDAQREKMKSAAPVIGYEGDPRRLLVVDDVEANRRLLVDYLLPLGFTMMEADNGEACLQQAQAQPPDLIVMDRMMPVMDGLEATHRLRQLPALKDVPIIAVSASVSVADEKNCLAGGANVFLAKPVDLARLLHEIGDLLQLNWISDPSKPTTAPRLDASGPVVPPPAQEMEFLRQLARIGNMRNIGERAEYLKNLDAKYAPFATRLASLAEACQSRAIVVLLDKYSAER